MGSWDYIRKQNKKCNDKNQKRIIYINIKKEKTPWLAAVKIIKKKKEKKRESFVFNFFNKKVKY